MTTEHEIVTKAKPGNYLKAVNPRGVPHYFKILEREYDELTLERQSDGEVVETRTKDLKRALDRVVVAEDPLETLYMVESEECVCC